MAENKRISDLETTESASINDLMELSSFVSQGEYASKKIGLGFLALDFLNKFTFEELNTEDKKIIGALNEIVKVERNGAVSGCTFVKCGKVVHVYGNLTSLASTATVDLGATPFKPVNSYAILPFISGTPPYNNQLGTLWIGRNGACTLYKTTSATSGYVYGSYVCE